MPRLFLFQLDGLEQRLEVALAEALRAVALDDLDEHGGAVLDGLGEDLQQIAFVVAVDENAEVVDGLHILVDLADAVGQDLVVGVGHAQELDAVVAQFDPRS